jgi:putative membrane protein
MVVRAMFSFLHFVAVFGIVATIFLEWQTISRTPTLAEAKRIRVCDRWYGIFAVWILVVGFLRVFYFEKGQAFYFANPFFHAKLTLFILIGLLSIYPTIRFVKWRVPLKQGVPPTLDAKEYKWIVMALRAELLLLLGMVLCASLMARGVGT